MRQISLAPSCFWRQLPNFSAIMIEDLEFIFELFSFFFILSFVCIFWVSFAIFCKLKKIL
jgi:hypothetical protein